MVQKKARRSPRTWTKETITQQLQSYMREGFNLTPRSLFKHDRSLAIYARITFGSVRQAFEASGIELPFEAVSLKEKQVWIISQVQDLQKNGIEITSKNIMAEYPLLVSRGKRIFGSWRKTLSASGIDPEEVILRRNNGSKNPQENVRLLSREETLEQIRQTYEQGKSLSVKKLRTQYVLKKAITTHFLSLAEALQEANIPGYTEL